MFAVLLGIVLTFGIVHAILSGRAPARTWRDCYRAGPAPPWAVGAGPFVSWADLDTPAWTRDVANNVGLVRLALNSKAALELLLPKLPGQLKNVPPVVVAATLVYHLHRCVAAPVTPTEAAEMALMVYYDAVYVTDPVGTLARVTAALPLAQPCAQTSWQAPHLLALGTQLARPLVAPPALCRRHQETRSTDPVDARKTE